MAKKGKCAWVEKADVSSVKTHSSRPSNAGPGSRADLILLEYGRLFGRGVAQMLAAVAKGGDKRKARKALQPGMNDRQASSAAFAAAGMAKSAAALLPMLADETRTKLELHRKKLDGLAADLAKAWDGLDNPQTRPFTRKAAVLAEAASLEGRIAWRRTKIDGLERRLAGQEERIREGRASVCLGTKKLFLAQHHLAANGLKDHAEWKAAWETARSSNILMMGGRGETAKNQICQASENPDGSFDLQLTIPPALWKAHGKHLILKNLRFEDSKKRKGVPKDHGKQLLSRLLAMPCGKDAVPISWRLTRDARGWLCAFTADEGEIEKRTSRLAGMIGVDVNADHLAVAAVDRHGNVLDAWNVPLDLAGLSAAQAKDRIGKAARDCARAAGERGFSLAMENLDFADKKAKSGTLSKRHRTMLSAFATRQILTALGRACRACRDEGVEAWSVNPAYTSIIGRHNHQGRTSMTSHQGAAAAIARRALGSRERPARRAVDAWKRVRAVRGSKGEGTPEDVPLPAGTGFWKGFSKAGAGTKRAQTGGAARPARQHGPSGPGRQSATVRGGPGETQSPRNQDPFGDRG